MTLVGTNFSHASPCILHEIVRILVYGCRAAYLDRELQRAVGLSTAKARQRGAFDIAILLHRASGTMQENSRGRGRCVFIRLSNGYPRVMLFQLDGSRVLFRR